MSVSVTTAIVVGFAMHLAIGGDTEDEMREDVWVQLGLCREIDETHSCSPGFIDPHDPDCAARTERQLPCSDKVDMRLHGHVPKRLWLSMPDKLVPEPSDQSWTERWKGKPECPLPVSSSTVTPVMPVTINYQCIPWGFLYTPLYEPDWVPADQPTPHRGLDGHWMKLRL